MRRILSVLLISAFILTGCSTAPTETSAEVTGSTGVTEVTAPSATEATKPSKYEFNPHVHTDLLSEICTEEHWQALYNMCDAIRAGEEAFECGNEEAFKWCTDDVTIGALFPAACMMVERGTYENGTGTIKYKISKEDMAVREQNFENEIVRILNAAVLPECSDFEKAMCLYDYMCNYFTYDHSDIDGAGVDDFGNYACFMTKKGICTELAACYAYLLLQCGVDALEYQEYSMAFHAWTYVLIDGKGYNVDVTWGLRPEDGGEMELKYFMMTDDERAAQGFDKDAYQIALLSYWKSDYDQSRFACNDTRFSELHDGTFVSIDLERKVIEYMADGLKEFSYE